MQLLLISASMLVASWVVMTFGLYFAIKFKEAKKVKSSKLFYLMTVIGEIFGEISWYMVIISVALMIVKMIS